MPPSDQHAKVTLRYYLGRMDPETEISVQRASFGEVGGALHAPLVGKDL
jgi:hypothetical protein